MSRSRWIQLVWGAVAAGLVVVAGLLHDPIQRQEKALDVGLAPERVAQTNPELSMLTVVPGGLRAPVINYLWIRSQKLKEKGRVYDAMQLADAICRLMPRFSGVWSFHAWNMAWNISVTTHTPDERWKWVSNGMELLRDQGIPINPEALVLYKDLGWLYFSKMGGTTDEMHMVYKRRWAKQMHDVLGAPPPGDAEDMQAATQVAIDWFRPIAEAPLDTTDLARRRTIQPDPRARLLEDPAVARYAELLAAQGIAIDESFLDAYNTFSTDQNVAVSRVAPPVLDTDQRKAKSRLINSPEHAGARHKILAFVRAQVLWNKYRLDPNWMLGLMERLEAPIDWRLVWPHGLYWVSYGMHVSESLSLDDVDSLNTDRIVHNCLKELTWNGRLTLRDNPSDPVMPAISMTADWRFIRPTHQEYLRIIEAVIETSGKPFEKNIFRDGHVNYLTNAIAMLVAGRQSAEAQRYYDWIKENYKKDDGVWKIDNVEQFVVERLRNQGSPIPRVAVSQITAALQTAYVALVRGSSETYTESINYARRVHAIYQKDAPERTKLQPLGVFAAEVVRALLIEPRSYGYNLTLEDRSVLYTSLPEGMRKFVYDAVTPYLRRQSEQAGMDYDEAFPEPPDMEQFRRQLRRERLGERESSEVQP